MGSGCCLIADWASAGRQKTSPAYSLEETRTLLINKIYCIVGRDAENSASYKKHRFGYFRYRSVFFCEVDAVDVSISIIYFCAKK
jgi:hypothetical protein